MNRKEVIKHIRNCVLHLEDVLGEVIFSGDRGSDVTELLARVLEVGNVSLMNSEELSMEELGLVESTLVFMGNVIKSSNSSSIEDRINSIKSVVTKVENLYREKNLLLGEETDKKVKCA